MPGARRIIVLGSTGSIGTATLEVVRHLRESGGPDYEVVGLAAGSNAARVAAQAEDFGVRHVAMSDPASASALPPGIECFAGEGGATALVERVARPGDMVMAASQAACSPSGRSLYLAARAHRQSAASNHCP